MSSTTDRSRGQVLAFFVISLTAILGAGALAFDGGLMILERRDQQNAADAAAMAGARFVNTNITQARAVAAQIAADNGFVNGTDTQFVSVDIPPTSGKFVTWPNAIQVRISSSRPSILGAVLGFFDWPVSANATAASFTGVGGPFSILALAPSVCDALKVAGTGGMVAHGNIQVNSDCATSALKRQGGGSISVTATGAACNVVGGFQDGGGSGTLACGGPGGAPFTGAASIPDPLEALPDVPMPGYPSAPVRVAGTRQIPNGCPGSNSPATVAAPAVCQFPSNHSSMTWRLFPGLYPGGLKLQGGTYYLEPGVYWIGGGGLEITGNGTTTRTVNTGGTSQGGGVLFYNTALPTDGFGAGSVSALGDIKLNGADANIHLWPLNVAKTSPNATWNGLIVYQDRAFSFDGDDLTINGNDAAGMDVRGTIYLPTGDVKVNGNEGDLIMDQIIAQTFIATGNGGDILALRDQDKIFKFSASGLVE